MAPYFIRNLIPRREARNANRRPLLEVLRTVTWVQWAQFLSGCVPFSLIAHSRWESKCVSARCVDGLLGLATRPTFSACRSASLAFKGNSRRTKLLPSYVVPFWPVLLLCGTRANELLITRVPLLRLRPSR